MRSRDWAGAVAGAAAVLLLAACGGGGARPAPPAPTATTGTPAPGRGPAVTKLLVFVVENHSLDQMRADLPFTFGLAETYGYATHYAALTHPSLPNYLAMAGGDTFDITDDQPPSAHELHGATVFGQALALGRTAKVYAEAMPVDCATDAAGRYAVKHNPWPYFVDEKGSCQRYDVPLTELAGDVDAGRLPNAGMVIPDLCNDAHDCDLSVADGWLRDHLGPVMRGPDWRSGRLIVVVTADEDDHNQGNLVLTALLHPSLQGVVVDTPLTHYSLTRLYDEVLGAPPLGAAADAASITTAFGLGSFVAGVPR